MCLNFYWMFWDIICSIGEYSNKKELSIQDYKPSWNGSCSRPESCTECPAFRTTKTRYMLQRTTQTDPATLIAFFAVSSQGADPYKCGKIQLGNFYRALATIFTLRHLSPIPYNLRGFVLDTCSNSLRIDKDLYSILSTGSICNAVTDFDGIINNSTIGGVITSTTQNVMAANRVLATLKIPIVATFATSIVLNDKYQFPYVARTISPDYQETAAIVELLHQNNWTFVSVVYSRDVYGRTGFSNFKLQAGKKGICIAVSITVPTENSVKEIQNALTQLTTTDSSNVVVLIDINPHQTLRVAKVLGIARQFLWIGTETWGTSQFESHIMNDLAGSLIIAMRNTVIPTFTNYIKSLTYEKRDGIPDDWFDEFYQKVHKCHLPSAKEVYHMYPMCNKTEIITDDILNIDNYVIYTTIAATYAIANGIQVTKNNICASKRSFNDCFTDTKNRELLFEHLLKTKWSGWTEDAGYDLEFNEDRFWDVGYDVYNLVKANDSFKYIKIGTTITDDISSLPIQTYKPISFTSQCPISKGCFCDNVVAKPNFSAAGLSSDKQALFKEPRNYYRYVSSRSRDLAFTWPVWAIVVCVPTCIGLFIGLFLFFFFLCAYPVRGGTTILGFMAIFGIACIFAVNFAFFMKASEITCGARRFCMGVVYAIVFAALLVKSVDNWRLNDSDYTPQKYSGITSACCLFLISLSIVAVQIIIPTEWLIIVHPTASLLATDRRHDWWYCDPVDTYDYSLAVSMTYVGFLVLLTAVFSGLSWDSSSNYYESRWICVGCIGTAGCFLVWMVVSTNAGPSYRDPAVALGNLFNATLLLICLPGRKLMLLISIKESKTERDDDIYANMDNYDIYSSVYHNETFDDYYHPLEKKLQAGEQGF